MDAAKVKAVEDALRRTRNEANAVAQSSGRTLGELSYASVDTYEQQPMRPMMAKAATMAAQAAPPADCRVQRREDHRDRARERVV